MKTTDFVMNKTYENNFLRMRQYPQLDKLREVLHTNINNAFNINLNGNLQKWLDAFYHLPTVEPSQINLNCPAPKIGQAEDLTEPDQFEKLLQEFIPWRKGPYEIFGVHIDAEWRSDLKWDRLRNNISDLQDRMVLDVGCGNGYHCLRMIGRKAKLVVGIDPNLLSVMQFKILQKYLGNQPVDVFPMGVEQLPDDIAAFDTVFTMGVIYHRKDPLEHLRKIRSFLKPGGEIILETLVVHGDENYCLFPAERYAQMRNVWQIPSVACAEKWLRQSGFCEIRTVDVSTTTAAEQRATDWMLFHSLPQFLNPGDNSQTIEGYPAPKRAILLGNK